MMKRLIMLMALALCLLALAFDAPPADAATIPVRCSTSELINAIQIANSNGPNPDTIELARDCTYALSSPYVQPSNYASWYGPSGLPAIASEITVVGNGSTIERAAQANTAFRLLFVGADPTDPDTRGYATPGPGNLTLRDLTLRGGVAKGGDALVGGGGGAGMGGAIFNQGEVTLERVTITNSTARGGTGGSGFGVGPGGGIGSNAGSTADSSGGGFGVGYISLGGGSGGTNSGGGGGFRDFEDGQSRIDPQTGGDGGGPATGLGGLGGAATGNPGMGGNGAGGGTPTSPASGNGGNGGDFGWGGVEGGGGGVGGGGATLNNGSGGGFGGGGGGANGGGGNGGFGGGGGNGSSIGIGGFGGGNGALISSSGGGGGGAGMGGAIFNHQGTLTLLNSTLSGNTAVRGLSGSAADDGRGLGGAIFNLNGAVRIDYSTIAYNTADEGGALYNLGYLAEDLNDPDGHTYSAHVVAAGSIMSTAVVSAAPAMLPGGLQNTVDDPGDTTIDLTASNLIGAATEIGDGAVLRGPNTLEGDPRFVGQLVENGGLTPTHALDPASPAIDNAQGNCPLTDQRGEARPSGFACDIGAFELHQDDSAVPTTTASANNADNSTYLSGEWTNQNVTVSLSAADNAGGSGLKEIRYTTDGTDPSASSTLYSAPFTVSGTTTVKYRAQDNAGNVEAIKTFEVKIDKTAPSISDQGPTTQPNAAGWYKTDVTNAFKATDSGSGLNDACITAFQANQAGDNVQSKTTTGEGTALKVTSDGCTDVAGNTAQGIDSANFKVDKTKPLISRDGVKSGTLGTNNWYTTDVGYGFTAADPNGANGSGLALADQAFTRTTSGQGVAIHVSSGTVTDQAGNVADAIDSPDFMIDKTAPTVPTGVSATAVASPVVTWTPSTDSVGVTKYNIKRSTTLGGTYTTVGSVTGTPPTASFTDSTAGPFTTYYYKVNAEDAATNASADSSASSPITTPDTTAPTVISTFPGSNGTMGKADLVTATFSEQMDASTVNTTTFYLKKYTIDKRGKETYVPVTAKVTTPSDSSVAVLNPTKDLTTGSYQATITKGVTDKAGNALVSPKTWSFKVTR